MSAPSSEKWALILGASSGFGAAASRELAANGFHIAGVHLDRRATLANVEKLSAAISRDIDPLIAKSKRALDGVGDLGAGVGPGQRESLRRTLDALGGISDRVGKVTTDAQLLVADLRAGKGTAGSVLKDDQLYDDIKEMVRDLKRNPWKFLWRE